MHPTPMRRQRGFSLVEALIAFLVLSLGMLAVVQLQPALRQHVEAARQRSEATRLAQQDIESSRSAAAIEPRTLTVEADTLGSPRYELTRGVDAAAVPNARAVTVTVRWVDRSGEAQQLVLATFIGNAEPALAAARVVPR